MIQVRLRHRPSLDVLHAAPAIPAAIVQPKKNTRSRVWRLPIPAEHPSRRAVRIRSTEQDGHNSERTTDHQSATEGARCAYLAVSIISMAWHVLE
jgi:hypothetical protein